MRRLISALALCLLLCGCAGQTEQVPIPALRSDNGRPVLQVGDAACFWRYGADSVEPEGLWGVYAPVPTARNQLVRLSADGTEETLWTGPGYGKLWYLDGRLFAALPAETGFYDLSLTCLTWEGEVLWTLDRAEVLAADEERGLLVCRDRAGAGTLFTLTADGTRTDLREDAAFLAYEDGTVYCQDKTAADQAILCRVDLDGAATELARVAVRHGDPEIVQAELADGTVWFLCGAYGGTAHVFQGGTLCAAGVDGAGVRVLAETGGFDGDRFFLRQDGGRTTLIFNQNWEDAAVRELDMETGASVETVFPMAGLREPFLGEDGALWWYPDRTGQAEALTEPVAFPAPGDDQTVRDMAVTEDWVWYTLETGRWSQTASIGWRDGYARERTWACRESRGGGAQELLYEY